MTNFKRFKTYVFAVSLFFDARILSRSWTYICINVYFERRSTSKQPKITIQCFLVLLQSFSHLTACTFSRTVWNWYATNVGIFQYKFHQFDQASSLLDSPDKKPKPNNSICYHKTYIHGYNKLRLTNERDFYGAVSEELCADWLVCIAYCISGIWLF